MLLLYIFLILILVVIISFVLFFFYFFFFFFFFFNDTATTEIYTLSLHDAFRSSSIRCDVVLSLISPRGWDRPLRDQRSEEHTSELQSLAYLVCRLLLEKKKKK